jgi:hypothetical protein
MITLHIIRSLNNASDDVITINKDGYLFSVSYMDRDSKFRYSFDASREQVIEYLYSIFEMLRIDEEPFHSIQVTLPAYPVINVKIASLNDKTIQTFMRPLKRSLLRWLTSVRPIGCACPVSRTYLEQTERTPQ